MASDTLGYTPLSKGRVVRLDSRALKILMSLAFLSGVIVFWTVTSVRRWSSLGPLSSALDNYQGINPFPMIHQDYEQVTPEQRAVVSALYTDSYVFPLAVLGHTLKKHHVSARRILIYLPNRVSKRTLCFVQAAGWELHPVEYIAPPHAGKGIHHSFVDQYTKLNIWKLDQLDIKTAVYLDADTMVRGNFDEIWNLPFEFGAVPDIWVDDPGFTAGFNAGILFFHPSTGIFKDLISKLETTNFRLKDAEQSYLNHYFGAHCVRLPYAYGGNIAIKERSPEMWKAMQGDMKVVHYTLVKPFEANLKCPQGKCDLSKVYDLKRQDTWLKTAKTKWKGNFAPEVTWWEELFNQMMREIGDLCPAS